MKKKFSLTFLFLSFLFVKSLLAVEWIEGPPRSYSDRELVHLTTTKNDKNFLRIFDEKGRNRFNIKSSYAGTGLVAYYFNKYGEYEGKQNYLASSNTFIRRAIKLIGSDHCEIYFSLVGATIREIYAECSDV